MAELAGDAFRRLGSLRLAVGRRGAGGSARRDRGALGRRARSRVDRRSGRASLRPLHRGYPPPDRRRAPACTARAGARRAGIGGGRRDRRGAVGERSIGARGRDRRHRDRRVPERPARRARGADHPDQGSGDRHGAAGGAPLREPALRASRLRLLAPDRGRADRGGRLPRRVAGTGVHGRGGLDRRRPAGAVGLRERASSGESSGSTTAGRGSSASCSTSCRSSGEVPGLPETWVAGGYSGHGNVLGFACGRLVARAILGDRDPLLDLFEPSRLLG